jgi:hypothetical protein
VRRAAGAQAAAAALAAGLYQQQQQQPLAVARWRPPQAARCPARRSVERDKLIAAHVLEVHRTAGRQQKQEEQANKVRGPGAARPGPAGGLQRCTQPRAACRPPHLAGAAL